METSNFNSVLEKANSILILLPTNPYFDQVAAALSLYLALESSKEVTVSCPSDMTVMFNRLVGVDRIKKDLGKKNLIVRLENYDGKNIERVSADMDNGVFALTVIPKQGMKAPEDNQVKLSRAGSTSDVVILVGGANDSHFPALKTKELSNAQVLHVGTRDVSLPSTKKISINENLSSVSEVVAKRFFGITSLVGVDQVLPAIFMLNSDIATNLLDGIEFATKSFTSGETSSETFFAVSRLMAAGGKRIEKTDTTKLPLGSIPGAKIENDSTNNPVREDTNRPPKDWFMKPKVYKGTSLK